MNLLIKSLAIAASLLFTGAAIAEETKDKISWLFVQTAETAEVTSEDTLVMPVTREIFAFTDRPNRLHGYINAHEFVAFWDEFLHRSCDMHPDVPKDPTDTKT